MGVQCRLETMENIKHVSHSLLPLVWFKKWLYKCKTSSCPLQSRWNFCVKTVSWCQLKCAQTPIKTKNVEDVHEGWEVGGGEALGDEEWGEFLRKSLIFAIIKNDGLLDGNRALNLKALSIETLKHNHVKIINFTSVRKFQSKWWLVVMERNTFSMRTRWPNYVVSQWRYLVVDGVDGDVWRVLGGMPGTTNSWVKTFSCQYKIWAAKLWAGKFGHRKFITGRTLVSVCCLVLANGKQLKNW